MVKSTSLPLRGRTKGATLPRVAQHADFLSMMRRTKNKKQRDRLIDLANKGQIESISEIIVNVLRGTIALSKVQKERMRKYKKCLRLVAAGKTALQAKKKQLKTYSGGFLPALIGLAAPVISSLIGALVRK